MTPGGASIEVLFLAHDQKAEEILTAINEFPAHTPERYEMEAFLFMTLMRASHRQADRLRDVQRRAEQREARRRAKG